MEILCYPNPFLRLKAEEVGDFDGELKDFGLEMAEFMRVSKGIGLAAPQVGESIRLIVVDLGEEHGNLVVVNPVLCVEGEKVVGEEGCLSLPGILGKVIRAEKVQLKGRNLSGKEIEVNAEGLLARVLQHETDHLDGTLFVDKLTPASRVSAEARLREMREGRGS